MSKIHAKKPVTQSIGPTFDHNDPAKFVNHGKSTGKTPVNHMEEQKVGPVFTTNTTHIPTMNADKPAPESKTLTDKKWFNPFDASNPVSAEDSPVHTNATRVLKDSYRKGNRK